MMTFSDWWSIVRWKTSYANNTTDSTPSSSVVHLRINQVMHNLRLKGQLCIINKFIIIPVICYLPTVFIDVKINRTHCFIYFPITLICCYGSRYLLKTSVGICIHSFASGMKYSLRCNCIMDEELNRLLLSKLSSGSCLNVSLRFETLLFSVWLENYQSRRIPPVNFTSTQSFVSTIYVTCIWAFSIQRQHQYNKRIIRLKTRTSW